MSETILRKRKEQVIVPGIGDLDEGVDEMVESPFEDAEELEAASEDFEEEESEEEENTQVTFEAQAEDDDEEDEAPPVRRPAVRRQPPRERSSSPRRSVSRSRPAKTSFSNEIAEELSNTLASINYEPGKHKITVYREEPEFDPESGKKIVGLCKTFTRIITPDDIQREFGGGKYKLTVMGPRADTGTGSQMKARFTLDIAGDPIVPMSEQQKKRLARQEERKQEELLERVLERQERREEQHKKELQEMNKTVFQVLEKSMNKPQADPQAATAAIMTPILTMMKEDSNRREREMEEQRRRDEDKRREEDRRWQEEREEARRRHEAEMKRQEEQAKVQLEQVRLQQEAMQNQMRMESESNKQQMEIMLKFMQKADSDKEARTREQTNLQMQVMGQISEIQKSSMETQLKLISEQLKEAKSNKKGGFLEEMEKYRTIDRLLNPGEPEKDTWEKILDRASDALPGVVTGLSALRQNVGGQPALPQSPLPPGRMAPGSVAVVENVDGVHPALPPAGYPSPMGGNPNAPQTHMPQEFHEIDKEAERRKALGLPEPSAEEVSMVPQVNDFSEFMPYPNHGSNEEVLTYLVKNLDLAMQRGLDEEAIYGKCLETLPLTQKQFLKMLPVDTLMAFVEANVPESWALRSLDGDMKLRAVHEKLVTSP